MRLRASVTGRQPPWRAAAARQEARHLVGNAGMATPPYSAATGAASEEAIPASRLKSATPPVFLVGNALERAAAGLLVHKASSAGVALHEVAVWGLKLRSVIHRTAPEPITCILCHVVSPLCWTSSTWGVIPGLQEAKIQLSRWLTIS